MTSRSHPAWLPALVWAGVVAVCGALLLVGTMVAGAGLLTVSPFGLLGGGFFLWVSYLIARAAHRGHALAQGALIIASFVLMAMMADGGPAPANYLDYEPFRFTDGLLRAVPGLLLAMIFASRRTSRYFEERRESSAVD